MVHFSTNCYHGAARWLSRLHARLHTHYHLCSSSSLAFSPSATCRGAATPAACLNQTACRRGHAGHGTTVMRRSLSSDAYLYWQHLWTLHTNATCLYERWTTDGGHWRLCVCRCCDFRARWRFCAAIHLRGRTLVAVANGNDGTAPCSPSACLYYIQQHSSISHGLLWGRSWWTDVAWFAGHGSPARGALWWRTHHTPFCCGTRCGCASLPCRATSRA